VTPDPITGVRILELFKEHWPPPRVKQHPGEWWCGHIAIMLQVVRDRRPPPPPPEPQAVKYGHLFIQHSDDMMQRIKNEAAQYCWIEVGPDGSEVPVIAVQMREKFDACQKAAAALELAVSSTQAALDAWRERDPLLISDHDPAKFIYERVQAAWESIGVAPPRSVNEDDPLCEFIAAALDLANIRVGQGKTQGNKYTAAAVSAVLRGRTDRLKFERIES
jgi:hypothetical protein